MHDYQAHIFLCMTCTIMLLEHNEALLEDNASIRIMRSDRICMIGSGFLIPPHVVWH